MNAYVDSSVLLRTALGEPGAFKDWDDFEKCYTSEIALVESFRVLDRLRLEGRLEDIELSQKMRSLRELSSALGFITLNRAVLDRASQSFPTLVGTLDAIHLGSALLYTERKRERLVFLTHDVRQAIAAQALGFEVRGAQAT